MSTAPLNTGQGACHRHKKGLTLSPYLFKKKDYSISEPGPLAWIFRLSPHMEGMNYELYQGFKMQGMRQGILERADKYL